MSTAIETPVSLSAFDVCTEVVQKWKETHGLERDLSRETRMLAWRVASWASPVSVAVGTMDVLSATRSTENALERELVVALSDKLASRLIEEGLILGQLRRATPPAATAPVAEHPLT